MSKAEPARSVRYDPGGRPPRGVRPGDGEPLSRSPPPTEERRTQESGAPPGTHRDQYWEAQVEWVKDFQREGGGVYWWKAHCDQYHRGYRNPAACSVAELEWFMTLVARGKHATTSGWEGPPREEPSAWRDWQGGGVSKEPGVVPWRLGLGLK